MRTKDDLRQYQALPLDLKISLTQRRIRDWVNYWGTNGVYVSFSGGKDSTVLLHLVRQLYPDVEAVFVNTGLEYPEIQKFVKTFDNVTILRPKMRFDEVITNYGYPLISKSVANCIRLAKSGSPYRLKRMRGEVMMKNGKRSWHNTDKYAPIMSCDFEVSELCCDVMKKKPAKEFEKKTGKKPFIATMAQESLLREKNWLAFGCNAFEGTRPKSTPMSFWTDQDVLLYLKNYMQQPIDDAWQSIYSTNKRKRKAARKYLRCWNYRKYAYATVYGDIVEVNQKEWDGVQTVVQTNLFETGDPLVTTGCDRTGCIFCAFGCHLDKEPSRFQKLKKTHPRQYEYCIGGGEYDENGVWKPNKQGLGMGHVFDELNKIYGDGFIKY